MQKMQDAKLQMDETKARLDSMIVEGESENGLIIVRANGNKKITEIIIDKYIVDEGDSEALSDLVLVAVNRALDAAEELNQKEMNQAAQGLIPEGLDIPGM